MAALMVKSLRDLYADSATASTAPPDSDTPVTPRPTDDDEDHDLNQDNHD